MSSSPSFGPFKKFQVVLLFAALTIVYLIYSIGSRGYETTYTGNEHYPTPSLAISTPSSHNDEDTSMKADHSVADSSKDEAHLPVPTVSIPSPPHEDEPAPATTSTSKTEEVKAPASSGENEHVSVPTPVTEDQLVPADNATSADTEEYVAFCVAHRNQRRDLPEFLNHHYHHHGIRRFYIMDDRSDPPLSSFNDFGIPRSALSFQYYDEKAQHPDMQEHIYSECARLYGTQHTWLAFIDADEFFETRDGETLPSILREFDNVTDVGALGVNWRLHSSANLTTRPESMRASFTSCVQDPEELPVDQLPSYKDNRLIKSVVKTAVFEKPLTPHLFQTRNGTHTVGEHGDKIDNEIGVRQPITRDRIGLHHYTTKSKEQFEEKMKSWSAKGWEYWDHIEGLPQVHCEEMTKYSP